MQILAGDFLCFILHEINPALNFHNRKTQVSPIFINFVLTHYVVNLVVFIYIIFHIPENASIHFL